MIEFNLQNELYKCFTERFEMLVYERMIKEKINPIKVADEIKEVVKQFALAYKWNDGGVCTTLHIKEQDGKCSFSIDFCLKEAADDGVMKISTEKVYRYYDDEEECEIFHSVSRVSTFDFNMEMNSSYKDGVVDYQSKEVKDKKIVKELQEEKKKLMDKINEAQDNKSDVQPLIDRMVEIDDEINKHMNELPF